MGLCSIIKVCTFVHHLKQSKEKMKPYTQFSDKYGNNYEFENYTDFAKFWFSFSYFSAKVLFPEFKSLQNLAVNSREARKKI